MKEKIKALLKKLPFAFTKNQRYDLLTKKIIKQYCATDSNCIDAGTHKGEILDLFLKAAPNGQHFGFEPIPELFSFLEKKYIGHHNCQVFPYALSSSKGSSQFNYVVTNPAYSGLKKRKYDKPESDQQITVLTERLDDVISPDLRIGMMKIDVEGGELDLMKGATGILSSSKPIIIFETGLGAGDVYGTSPEEVFDFLSGFGYGIFLLQDFLDKKTAVSREGFCKQFYGRKNYYFVAGWIVLNSE
jgi:FkbM family methyltransferase